MRANAADQAKAKAEVAAAAAELCTHEVLLNLESIPVPLLSGLLLKRACGRTKPCRKWIPRRTLGTS